MSEAAHMDIAPYLPLVQKIAKALNRRMRSDGGGRHIRLEDFESAGYVGLVQAAATYDGRRDFAAYAYHRIRGAIIDDLRANLPLSRVHWAQVKAGECLAIECPLSAHLYETLTSEAPTPEASALQASNLRRVRAAIATLPDWRSRRLLERFDRDETLKDVAAVFGVNESRASQLQKSALRQVRQILLRSQDAGIDQRQTAARTAVPLESTIRSWTDAERQARSIRNRASRRAAYARDLIRGKNRPTTRAAIAMSSGDRDDDYLALRVKHAARLRELYPIPEFQIEARSPECE
jgi:RNA polymerase sigma factor for flagellar operon FliA